MKHFKAKKSDPKITTTLRVPNTTEGIKFIDQLRYFATGGTRIKLHGRGPRTKWARARYNNGIVEKRTHQNGCRAFDQDLPAEFAEYFAVFITKPALVNRFYERARAEREYWRERDAQKLSAATDEIKRLDADRLELMRQRDVLQKEVGRLREDLRKRADASRTTKDKVINVTIIVPMGEA